MQSLWAEHQSVIIAEHGDCAITYRTRAGATADILCVWSDPRTLDQDPTRRVALFAQRSQLPPGAASGDTFTFGLDRYNVINIASEHLNGVYIVAERARA